MEDINKIMVALKLQFQLVSMETKHSHRAKGKMSSLQNKQGFS